MTVKHVAVLKVRGFSLVSKGFNFADVAYPPVDRRRRVKIG
jgi:hypothetical protein